VSSIVTEQGIVHYEVHGRGRPVILLHGWINSWDVWRNTMMTLAERGDFKVYALDFWGFGESAKDKAPPFKLDSYVQMVDQFMDTLGIRRAPVFGHSMGGTVTLRLVLEHPERVSRFGIVGSPIRGASLNLYLKLAGVPWIAQMMRGLPVALNLIMWVILAGDGKQTREMIFRDVNKTSTESFFRSIGDLHSTDLQRAIGQIRVPAIGIFGARDNIVNPDQADVMRRALPRARVEMMTASRHFPMFDEPERFNGILLEFLQEEVEGT
jgi:pimeloyl-ACP methyl ester carboxylesterase